MTLTFTMSYLLTLVLKLCNLLRIIHDTMRVVNQKTTTNSKVRALEQLFMLDPVRFNTLV